MAGLNPPEVNAVTGVAVTPEALPFPLPRLLLLTEIRVVAEKAPANPIYNDALTPLVGVVAKLNVIVSVVPLNLPA